MKRKPIFVVRMATNGLTVSGQLTIAATGPYFASDAERHAAVATFVARLRRDIGLEVTPKQPEAHR